MAASYGGDFADARSFGWTCQDLRFDWPTLIHNVRREVDRLNGVYTRTLERAGVDRFLTRAVLESPHEVKLADRDAHALDQDHPGRDRRASDDP